MHLDYQLSVLTTKDNAVRFRRVKANFHNNHETLEALLNIYERVGGFDIIKSQQAAEIGSFVTSDMADNIYSKKRGRPSLHP